jgi:hypothetical protein
VYAVSGDDSVGDEQRCDDGDRELMLS